MRGVNNVTLKKSTVTKHPETHGSGQNPHRVVAPLKAKFRCFDRKEKKLLERENEECLLH
jgi:hypothetical protein